MSGASELRKPPTSMLDDESARRLSGLLMEQAQQGDVQAQVALGQLLLAGKGITADPPLARRWFEIAARSGHAEALNLLGRCLENGWGGPLDLPGAADCYAQAAEAGEHWAMFNLAQLLLKGTGIGADPRRACRLLQRSAAAGNAKAMTQLGVLHEEGLIGPVDRETAEHCYRQAAAGGDFRGRFRLAALLLDEPQRQGEALAALRQALAETPPAFYPQALAELAASEHDVVRQLAEDYRRGAVVQP